MTPRVKHIHRYERKNLGAVKIEKGKVVGKTKYLVYACNKPECTHYIRRDLVSGKICECNSCGAVMTMDKRAITMARPTCPNCFKGKRDAKKQSSYEKLMELVSADDKGYKESTNN